MRRLSAAGLRSSWLVLRGRVLLGGALLALGLIAAPLRAGELSDLLLAPGLWEQSGPGELLRYRRVQNLPARSGDAAAASGAGRSADQLRPLDVDGADLLLIAAEARGQRALLLALEQEGEQRLVGQFPPQGANPVLLYFLESVVRDAAAQSGGSPFYIKNRLLEALTGADLPEPTPRPPGMSGAAGSGAATGMAPGELVAVLEPFAMDPNRARMGEIASLKLHLRFDPARPGRLLSLKADTAAGEGGYTDSLELTGEAR